MTKLYKFVGVKTITSVRVVVWCSRPALLIAALLWLCGADQCVCCSVVQTNHLRATLVQVTIYCLFLLVWCTTSSFDLALFTEELLLGAQLQLYQ